MILIDAGPLLALHDRRDVAHLPCIEATRQIGAEPIVTTWPCITEAMYFLGISGGFHLQAPAGEVARHGYLEIADLSLPEAELTAMLMEKYSDLPMDLADATLVAMAQVCACKKVLTLDEHFYVYRLRDGGTLMLLLDEGTP